MTLFYVPLEPYKERYTMQWSAPETGWLERRWREAGIEYHRVDPGPPERQSIKAGAVLDAVGRSVYCFSQITMLLELAERGEIDDDDVIYFDDFWTPGLEALPYAFHLLGIKPRMYAFLHAQSVDEFDFTYPMRRWMRPIETGFAKALTGIFVCGHTLKDLVVLGGIAPEDKVHVTGHPFASDEVMERMPQQYRYVIRGQLPEGTAGVHSFPGRLNRVVYSSRFDAEKNPHFFMDVFERVQEEYDNVFEFVVCTGSAQLRSNDKAALLRARDLAETYPDTFKIKEGLTKEAYYMELCGAKVQLNTADQDFVAITLLEAAVAGCYPIYPYFRSFPETFARQPGFMYERLDVGHAATMIMDTLNRNDLWSPHEISKRDWLFKRFDSSWARMLYHMGIGFDHAVQGTRYLRDPYLYDPKEEADDREDHTS